MEAIMTDFEMNERIAEVLAEQEGVYDAWNKRKQKKRTRLHKTYKKEFALKKALEEAPKSFNIYLTSRVLDFYDESIDLVRNLYLMRFCYIKHCSSKSSRYAKHLTTRYLRKIKYDDTPCGKGNSFHYLIDYIRYVD